MSIDLNDIIPIGDLATVIPSQYDHIVVEQNGRARKVLAPEVNAAAAALSGALNDMVAQAEADIEPAMANVGYLPPVAFAGGILVDSTRITVERDGKVYAALKSAMPFTTTATFNPAQWRLLQGLTGADLASAGGAGMVGFIQDGTGAVPRRLSDRDREVVHYGDHATLQQSIDAAFTSGKKLVGRKGLAVVINAPLQIPPSLNADLSGMVIVAGPAITSGPAVIFDGGFGTQRSGQISGLHVRRNLVDGHADLSSQVDGLSLRGGAGQVSDMSFYDLRIEGFRDNLRFDGPNSYLNHFFNPKIGKAWRRGVAVYSSMNSNENYSFFGGTIFDCNNTGFNAVGVYVDPGAASCGMSFFGTSIDYCDVSIEQTHGFIGLFGCHLENNNNNPHAIVRFTPGKDRPFLHVRGGLMVGGPGVTGWSGIAPESAAGRPAWISVRDGDCRVKVDGTKVGEYKLGAYITHLVEVISPGNLIAADLQPVMDGGTGAGSPVPQGICRATSMLRNVNGALTGWTQNTGSGVTFSSNADAAGPDTSSRQIAGTSSGNASLSQQFALPHPFKTLVVRARIKVTDVATGSASIRANFLDSTGASIQSVFSETVASATPGWIDRWIMQRIPSGTATIQIQDSVTGFTGTARFSDERAWVV